VYVNRSIEQRLLEYAASYKAVLVTGARQTGKSTLLKKIFPKRRYVTLDDPFVEEQARENGAGFFLLNSPPVTIDEVQRAPELLRYIKIMCDESEDTGLFCLSGSQQFHLMQGVSETLSGRIGILELSTMSLREIMKDSFNIPFLPTQEYLLKRKESAKQPKNLWQIIHRGGYPELVTGKKDWEAFYADYVKTYIERDVRALSAVQDLDAFRRFMVSAASRSGAMLNFSNIADEVGKDVKTIKNWISILETSGLVYLLEPYRASVLKRSIKTAKLYFRDTGLVAYLTRWLTAEQAAVGAMSGQLFETFAVSEILKSYSNAGKDYRYFVSYYRGKDGKDGESEIDLIIEENGVLYPVEIKQNAKVTADMTSAFQILDKLPDKKRGTGAILCSCLQPAFLRENILQLPVWWV